MSHIPPDKEGLTFELSDSEQHEEELAIYREFIFEDVTERVGSEAEVILVDAPVRCAAVALEICPSFDDVTPTIDSHYIQYEFTEIRAANDPWSIRSRFELPNSREIF